MYTPGDGGDDDQISYPLERIREVANQIIKDANEGLNLHEQAWAQVSRYADTTPPDETTVSRFHPGSGIQPVKMVLIPHERRLRATYEWQIALGKTLLRMADMMEQQDQDLVQGFDASSPSAPNSTGNRQRFSL